MDEYQKEKEEQPVEVSKKKWFGRGIYGSKDVPIRLLDGLIIFLLVAIVGFTTIFSLTGGYRVTFDTLGGSEVPYQKLRYGHSLEEPEAPSRPGYEFRDWVDSETNLIWNFDQDKVKGDITLMARWKPAGMLVKFDLNGGLYQNNDKIDPIEVIFGDDYGELPEPERTGYEFDGWVYSGAVIESTSKVSMTGEHVLTAQWKAKT